jgi:hypothetical protein
VAIVAMLVFEHHFVGAFPAETARFALAGVAGLLAVVFA